MGKEFLGEADTTGHNPDATKTESENSCHRSRLKRDGNRLGRTDELRCLPHIFLLLFSLAPLAPFRFVAHILRNPVISNAVNLFQQQPVFDSYLRVLVFDVTTHCHQQCASAHLAKQRKSHQLYQTLFRGVMTPFHSRS